MTTAWSEKTKEKLIAVDTAIANFVSKNWQNGSVEPVANAWSDFVLSESDDSEKQGFGKKPIARDINRGFRDYPFFNGQNLDFLRNLKAEDKAVRDRVYSDVGTLLAYFAPWDWEENEAKPRGQIAADGLASSAAINKLRFRVLSELATLESKIAEAQAGIIDKAASDFAASLGIDVSRGTVQSLKDIYAKNQIAFLGGAGLLIGALVFAIIKGRK